jgi:hypothetical protein
MRFKLKTAPQLMTARSTQQILAVLVGLSLATGAIASSPSPAPKAQDTLLVLSPSFSPDPQVTNGVSGGDRFTPNCGYVNALAQPNHVITLTQPFTFLQASVQAEGDVTLLIETPSGRLICSDDVNGLMPEISGEAPAGTYKIWVGDYGDSAANKAVGRAGGYVYRLSLTEKQS